jgi:hypothetical protein
MAAAQSQQSSNAALKPGAEGAAVRCHETHGLFQAISLAAMLD